ncbi:MAG: PAS domain-containing protein, partial [Verrucomicrobiota bacterium]
MNTGIIDRLIDRLDKLEPEEVERLVLRTVQEKGFLEKVFEVVRDGIIVCSEEGSVHYINHAACDFFGIESKVA